MERKKDVKIEKKGENYLVTETIVVELTFPEMLKQIQHNEKQLLKLRGQVNDISKKISDKALENDLKLVSEDLAYHERIMKDLEEKTSDAVKSWKLGIKKKISRLKIKRGYSRLQGDKRIVASGTILNEVLSSEDIAPDHPFIRELRNDFDKL